MSKELYGMPYILDACEVVIRLFHTFSSAFVNSSFVHERGGPPRGALCWPLGPLGPKRGFPNLSIASFFHIFPPKALDGVLGVDVGLPAWAATLAASTPSNAFGGKYIYFLLAQRTINELAKIERTSY
jgi:hypothetical protein